MKILFTNGTTKNRRKLTPEKHAPHNRKDGGAQRKHETKTIKNLVEIIRIAALLFAFACPILSLSRSFILDYIQIAQIQHARPHTLGTYTHTNARMQTHQKTYFPASRLHI